MACATAVTVACGKGGTSDEIGAGDAAGGGTGLDAGGGGDAGATGSGGEDGGPVMDSGRADGGPVLDAGAGGDAGDASTQDAASNDSGIFADAGEDAPVAPDGGPVDAGSDDAAALNACRAAGGICVFDTAACTGGGGTSLPVGDPGCVFSDGPGVCCEPPAPSPSGDSCQEHGGLCAPISGCNFVNGSFAPSDPMCFFALELCCVPDSICGVEDVHCCDPSGPTGYRPVCDRGTFSCSHIPGTVLVPENMCPP